MRGGAATSACVRAGDSELLALHLGVPRLVCPQGGMLRRAVGACASALQLSNQASCRGHGTALAGLCTAAQRFAHGDETIEQIRSRIFGNHIGNGLRSGRKVLRRKLVGDKVASYYPEPIERLDRMWEDPSEQECALLWPFPAHTAVSQAWC